MSTSKRTDVEIAGAAEATRLAITMGRELRSARKRLRFSQQRLGERVGLRQSRISEIERGGGTTLPLGTWLALGIAVGRPLAITLSRPILDPDLVDAGHLDIQEGLVALAAHHRYPVRVEFATRPSAPSYSVDVAARDHDGRYLLLEGWNRFGDLGASIRSTDRKTAELRALSPGADIRVCWVVRATAANRALFRRYPGIIRSRFPGSSTAWARALTDGTEPPAEPGVVWWTDGRPTAVRWPGATTP
jgi:transcriptional regulator with XRE-family HTH domain